MEIKKKKPKQDRSKFTVDSIIEATARILNGDVKGTLTTNKIAEVAGVSVGSLYQYFKNKESIIEELFTKKMLSSLEHFFQSVEEAHGQKLSTEDYLDQLVRNQFDSWNKKSAVSKTLMRFAPKVLDFSYFIRNDKIIIDFLKRKIRGIDESEIRQDNLEISLKMSVQMLRMSIYTYYYDPDAYDYDAWVEETAICMKKYLLK